MRLGALMEGAAIVGAATGALDTEVTGVSYDSRRVRRGDLFVAVRGYATDGHRYIGQAKERGAAAVVCMEPPEAGADIPWVQAADSRRALAVLSANWFGHPAESMVTAAVTGTCGKTTSTYLIKHILEQAAGAKTGLIGTNQNMIGQEAFHADRTTPESYEVQKLFARMRDAGCSHAVMETSSHALCEDRVFGVTFDAGVFTNLSQDHLDFHKTMENYCDAKAILFRCCKTGVVNGDDPWTPRLLSQATCRPLRFGTGPACDLRAENIALSADGVSFDALYQGRRQAVRVGIPGGYMVYNALDALGAALALGVPLPDAAAALETAPPVMGRLETVPTPGKPYTVLIDFAHTPDSMENVLRTVRGFAKGRVITVFGCGGDRDRTKRPKMGRAAAEYSDLAIVTTDNPRTEDPAAIIADILPGFSGGGAPYQVEADRVEAIHQAMDAASAGDVIVLCGKGHETYQEVGREKRHMDEREIVADWLEQEKRENPEKKREE